MDNKYVAKLLKWLLEGQSTKSSTSPRQTSLSSVRASLPQEYAGHYVVVDASEYLLRVWELLEASHQHLEGDELERTQIIEEHTNMFLQAGLTPVLAYKPGDHTDFFVTSYERINGKFIQ